MSGNGGGSKPDFKVAIKPKAGDGGRISLVAAWRKDGGKLSASLDRRIVRMVIVMDDGTEVDVIKDADGKFSHYVDMFENDAGGASPKSAARPKAPIASMDDLLGGGGNSGGDGPVDNLSDDIPFDRLRGEWR